MKGFHMNRVAIVLAVFLADEKQADFRVMTFTGQRTARLGISASLKPSLSTLRQLLVEEI